VVPQRIWRLKKLHQAVDAELLVFNESQVDVRFLFNGEVSYVRSCNSRQQALSEAAAKRAEMEREGWAFHW
jgi:hypothetical protein